MFDGKAFGAEIVEAVRGHVNRVTAPLIRRIDELEARLAALPEPKAGKDADPAVVRAAVEDALAARPMPRDGLDADPVETAAMVKAEVERAVSAIPPARDGESVTLDDVAPLIREEVTKAVAALPTPRDGEDGESVDPLAVERMVAERVDHAVMGLRSALNEETTRLEAAVTERVAAEVERAVSAAVAALPPPRDGEDADPVAIAAMVERAVEARVAALPAPKDGVGLAGALIDKDGGLVVTMTDGATRSLGRVAGRDIEPAEVAEMVRAEVAKIPPPRDGVDGLGFDDMTVEYDGERAVTFRFARGEHVKEFRADLPVVLDRGVYRDGATYVRGDAVTWAGSLWIAQRETTDKPDAGGGSWRLAVKRGRDGKDGINVPTVPVVASPRAKSSA